MTAGLREHVGELAGVAAEDDMDLDSEPDPVDEGSLWARFDRVADREQLLDSLDEIAKCNEEIINYQWSGDSADEPPTRMAQEIELVRSLLTRSGYEEVSVATGIDQELADRGALGGFYAMRSNHPRWAAKIVFRRNLSDPG
jgi:hypothetical protein